MRILKSALIGAIATWLVHILIMIYYPHNGMFQVDAVIVMVVIGLALRIKYLQP